MSTWDSALWGHGQPGFNPPAGPTPTPNPGSLTGNFGQTQPGYIPPPIPALTTGKLIYAAYRIAGILKGAQRGLSPEELQEGLECLNALFDVWNAQRYIVLSIPRMVFPLVAGQAVYEIGPTAADWVVARPPKIEDVSLISTENASHPLEIPLAVLTFDNWQLICVKNIHSTYPQACWYDPAQTWLPNARISFWPVPSINYLIALYAWTQIAQSVSATTALLLAPGYQQALQYELAIELCPRWRQAVPPDVRTAAVEYKKVIKSVNAPTLDLRCDAGLLTNDRNVFNWRTGGSGRSSGY